MGSYNPCERDTKSLNVGLVLMSGHILKNKCVSPNCHVKEIEVKKVNT